MQPGTFTMGSPETEPGRTPDETQHTVTLTASVYVCKHEITQAEWQSVMGWNESAFSGNDRPVEQVTWFDALRFCNNLSSRDGYSAVYVLSNQTYSGVHVTNATVDWVLGSDGYRLPLEAEWEYACRAASSTAFCNGGITELACGADPNLAEVGWYCGNSSGAPHLTEGLDANVWGLKDFHGNVLEWCWDWYGAYPSGPVSNPVGPSTGSKRVQRGGSWLSNASDCRSAVRASRGPGERDHSIGLRVVKPGP